MDEPMTYKGYCATIEYSGKDECLIGRITDISQSVTFRGESVKEMKQAFENAVDAYLDHCAEINEEPEKPSHGRAIVRISPALHSILALAAGKEKKSIGEWLAEVRKKPDGKKS